MPLGMTLSAFLVFVIYRRSFGWIMPLMFDARSLALGMASERGQARA
jgi:hypothetical protein